MQWKPNVTVAAIATSNNRFLLVEEKIDGMTLFNQPAGHLEPDESLLDAIVREVQEETAWQFKPKALVGIYLFPGPGEISYLRFCFNGSCGDFNKQQKLDEGIVRAVWMSRDEIAACKTRHRSSMVMQCVDDYLAGKRYPLEILNTYLDAEP